MLVLVYRGLASRQVGAPGAKCRRFSTVRAVHASRRAAACLAFAAGWLGMLLEGASSAEPTKSQLAIRLPAPPDATSAPERTARAGQQPEPRPVVVALRQPDEPRSPVVQPVPLPPPAEGIPPGDAAGRGIAPPTYGNTGLRPIGSLTINIVPTPGQVPREVDPTRKLETEFGPTEFRREPLNMDYRWESPAFWNQPLYFEQPNLERYGYDWGIAQPFISGAQFFVKIPLLPYMMTVHCPREPIYSLGYYRPGSRAPYQINWPEVRLDASIIEGVFITGLVFLIP